MTKKGLFGFISGSKMTKNSKKKKERKKKERAKKKFVTFFYVLLQKNDAFFAFFYVLCKRTLRSLRSFTFFAKERCVLCVLLRSLQKNVAFLRSFTFFRKERKRTHRSFGFHKSPKTRKKNVKERCVL
jgi:hypothetical protein